MGVFALKRFAGAEEGSEPRHHLSLVSHDNWSVTANADLPFKNEPVYGSSCRALVYFMGKNGKIVVCNLATRKWKVFSLPDHLSAASSVQVDACGLGYDPISRDYKLFRHIVRYLNEEERVGDKVVALRYLGYKDYTQVYSFKSDCWEAITAPHAVFIIPCAVYVAGSCYWTAFGGLEDDPCRHHILAFDIAIEEYNYLSFPQTCFGEEAWSKVVDYRGSLGALIYAGPEASDWTDSSPLFINIFVRREDTWQMLFDLKFDNVERPLGIGESRDGNSILFLDGKHTIQKSELMVYDFHSKELNRIGIYDYRSHMVVISFDFKKDRPPGSTPMPFIDNIVSSSEDVEEMKTVIDKKTKSERRRKKKKKTMFEVLPIS